MHANRSFTLVVFVALVAVIAFTIREARATSASATDSHALQAQRLERSRAADTARLTAMAQHYQALEGAQTMERSRAAETARWTAMAEYYQQLEQSQIQRSRAADSARWNAMAKYYQRIGQ